MWSANRVSTLELRVSSLVLSQGTFCTSSGTTFLARGRLPGTALFLFFWTSCQVKLDNVHEVGACTNDAPHGRSRSLHTQFAIDGSECPRADSLPCSF